MDPVTVVVAALVAGAVAGASNVASALVADTYQALKGLVLSRLRTAGVSEVAGQNLITNATQQEIGRTALTEELTRVGVDDPTLEAAQRLLDLLEQQKGKFVVDASQAKGLIVGDQGVQNNTFN